MNILLPRICAIDLLELLATTTSAPRAKFFRRGIPHSRIILVFLVEQKKKEKKRRKILEFWIENKFQATKTGLFRTFGTVVLTSRTHQYLAGIFYQQFSLLENQTNSGYFSVKIKFLKLKILELPDFSGTFYSGITQKLSDSK